MNVLILVNGKAGSGKDTVCDILVDKVMTKYFMPIIKIGNADAVRKLCKDFYGWNEVKDEKGRQLLIDVTDAGYSYDPFFWEKKSHKSMLSWLAYMPTNRDKNIVLNDWRYESTYNYYSTVGSFKVVTLRVEGNHKKYSEAILQDKSEVGLDNFSFDYRITNYGDLNNLEKQCDNFLYFLGGKLDESKANERKK